MQNYIDRALESFQHVFSRTSTWLLFCAIVIGFHGGTVLYKFALQINKI